MATCTMGESVVWLRSPPQSFPFWMVRPVNKMKHVIALIFSFAVLTILAFRLVIAPWLRKRRHFQTFQYCQSVTIPGMPEILDKTYLLPSERNKLFSYRLNLFHLTCTCRHFKTYRGFFPKNDLRRLCRHLRAELHVINAIGLFDELLRAVITDRIRDKCYERFTVNDNEIIAGFNPNRDMVRIFAKIRHQDDPASGPFTGETKKFVLNHQEEFWIHGDVPPNGDAIIDITKEILARFKKCDEQAKPSRPVLPDPGES